MHCDLIETICRATALVGIRRDHREQSRLLHLQPFWELLTVLCADIYAVFAASPDVRVTYYYYRNPGRPSAKSDVS